MLVILRGTPICLVYEENIPLLLALAAQTSKESAPAGDQPTQAEKSAAVAVALRQSA